MKAKITYLNCVLTVIAVALTVLILQNANIIQPAQANTLQQTVDVNVSEVGGMPVFPAPGIYGGIPVTIK